MKNRLDVISKANVEFVELRELMDSTPTFRQRVRIFTTLMQNDAPFFTVIFLVSFLYTTLFRFLVFYYRGEMNIFYLSLIPLTLGAIFTISVRFLRSYVYNSYTFKEIVRIRAAAKQENEDYWNNVAKYNCNIDVMRIKNQPTFILSVITTCALLCGGSAIVPVLLLIPVLVRYSFDQFALLKAMSKTPVISCRPKIISTTTTSLLPERTTTKIHKRAMKLIAAGTAGPSSNPKTRRAVFVATATFTVAAAVSGFDVTFGMLNEHVPVLQQLMDHYKHGVSTTTLSTRNAFYELHQSGYDISGLANEHGRLYDNLAEDRLRHIKEAERVAERSEMFNLFDGQFKKQEAFYAEILKKHGKQYTELVNLVNDLFEELKDLKSSRKEESVELINVLRDVKSSGKEESVE